MPFDLTDVQFRVRIVRAAFSRKGETARAFAERLGFSETAWNNYEKTQRPGLDAAIRIVERLGLTLDWLYLGDATTLRYTVSEQLREAQEALKGGGVEETTVRAGRAGRAGDKSPSTKPSRISRAKSRTIRA